MQTFKVLRFYKKLVSSILRKFRSNFYPNPKPNPKSNPKRNLLCIICFDFHKSIEYTQKLLQIKKDVLLKYEGIQKERK